MPKNVKNATALIIITTKQRPLNFHRLEKVCELWTNQKLYTTEHRSPSKNLIKSNDEY